MRGGGWKLGLIMIAVLVACASPASAATVPAKWMAEGVGLVGAETISGGAQSHLSVVIKKSSYIVKCNTNLVGTITQVDQAEATLTFANCFAVEPGGEGEEVNSPCKFEQAPAVLKGQVVGIGGASYILFVSKAGEVFTTITIGECVGKNGTYTVKGNTCAGGPALGGEAVENEFTWSEFGTNKCVMETAKYQGITAIAGLTAEANPAVFWLPIKIKMTGKRNGQKFGAK